jgi:hypothetical protein
VKKERKPKMAAAPKAVCALLPALQASYLPAVKEKIRELLTFQDPTTVLSLAQHNEYWPLPIERWDLQMMCAGLASKRRRVQVHESMISYSAEAR